MTIAVRSAMPADEAPVLGLFEELLDPPGRRPRDYGMAQASLNFGREIA